MEHPPLNSYTDASYFDLAKDINSQSFFFASPTVSILAEGHGAVIEARDTHEIKEQIKHQFSGKRNFNGSRPLLVGAVPFNTSSKTRLFIPNDIRCAPGITNPAGGSVSKSTTFRTRTNRIYLPSTSVYGDWVEESLEAISNSQLKKVVLARLLKLEACEPIDINTLLSNMLRGNPLGYTFSVPLEGLGENKQHSFVGASPELLVSRNGSIVFANPLAGSIPRSTDPIEDKQRADALLLSHKDLHEHALVVSSVTKVLRNFCTHVDAPASPSLIHTETMWHLSTEITGMLDDSSVTSLDIAQALHPTPAVCGHPTYLAQNAIKRLENFDRGFFTGIVGWMNSDGDGEWAVAIRCAEIEGQNICLYAGAGIVEGSEANKEILETKAKFQTMLNAIGVTNQ